MAYRLGIDLGTSSAALFAWKWDFQQQVPEQALHSELRIFDEPLEPKTLQTKNTNRRLKRQQRRLHKRRSLRMRSIARTLARLLDTQPSTSSRQVIRWRAEATHSQLSRSQLFAVFMHLAKKRGYNGKVSLAQREKIRKEQEKRHSKGNHSKEPGTQEGIINLEHALKQAECATIGQYLYHLQKKGGTTKLKELGLHCTREQVHAEFNAIWQEQSKHHKELTKAGYEQLTQAIFFQRPLKSVAGMTGGCQLEPNLPRAPRAHPLAQEFILRKQLVDLRIYTLGNRKHARSLDQAQVQFLLTLLQQQQSISFEKIVKTLSSHGLVKADSKLNHTSLSKPELKGDTTRATMRKLGMLEQWQALEPGNQTTIINLLADMDSSLFKQPDWHMSIANAKTSECRQFKQPVIDFINQLAQHPKYGTLSAMGFASGRLAYSLKALRNLNQYMADNPKSDEYEATQAYYGDRLQEREQITRTNQLLPPPNTHNVVVDRALRQLYYSINHVIEKLSEKPQEIVIEYMRDLPKSPTRRHEEQKAMRANEKINKQAKEELKKHGSPQTNNNIFRFKLFKQQKHYCPYCNAQINLSQAVDGNATNHEHIYPKAITNVGRQSKHLVLAHIACNNKKGKRTPYLAFHNDPSRWQAVERMAKIFTDSKLDFKAKALLDDTETIEDVTEKQISDFTERQMHETRWIAKECGKWLRQLCSVESSRGKLTDLVRRRAGLHMLIPRLRWEAGLPVFERGQATTKIKERALIIKEHESEVQKGKISIDKRTDHRHHLVDAAVIGLLTRSLYQRMANEEKAKGHLKDLSIGKLTSSGLNIYAEVEEKVRSTYIHFKPDYHPSGAFFQDTAYRVEHFEEGDRNSRLSHRIDLREQLVGLKKYEKAEKYLQSLVSRNTAMAVAQALNERRQKGKSYKEAITEPFYQHCYGKHTPIIRVRAYAKIGKGHINGEKALPIVKQSKGGKIHKASFLSSGYAYVRVIFDEAGKFIASQSVNLLEHKQREQLPLELGQMETRYYLNEVVMHNNAHWRVAQFKEGGTLCLQQSTEAIPYADARALSKGRVSLVTEIKGKNVAKLVKANGC